MISLFCVALEHIEKSNSSVGFKSLASSHFSVSCLVYDIAHNQGNVEIPQ